MSRGGSKYIGLRLKKMEEDETEVLTPEEQEKTLKEIPEEQLQKGENEED